MPAGRVYPIKFNCDGAACAVETLSVLGGTTNQRYNRSGGAVTLSNDGRYLAVSSNTKPLTTAKMQDTGQRG